MSSVSLPRRFDVRKLPVELPSASGISALLDHALCRGGADDFGPRGNADIGHDALGRDIARVVQLHLVCGFASNQDLLRAANVRRDERSLIRSQHARLVRAEPASVRR